jgi:hypothetical protein
MPGEVAPTCWKKSALDGEHGRITQRDDGRRARQAREESGLSDQLALAPRGWGGVDSRPACTLVVVMSFDRPVRA